MQHFTNQAHLKLGPHHLWNWHIASFNLLSTYWIGIQPINLAESKELGRALRTNNEKARHAMKNVLWLLYLKHAGGSELGMAQLIMQRFTNQAHPKLGPHHIGNWHIANLACQAPIRLVSNCEFSKAEGTN